MFTASSMSLRLEVKVHVTALFVDNLVDVLMELCSVLVTDRVNVLEVVVELTHANATDLVGHSRTRFRN